jgi:nucleoside-diphosphate-sugar epimerase
MPETERSVLVTGAMGCVGAWTVRELAIRGLRVVAFDRSTERRRLTLVMSDEEMESVAFVAGDLVDLPTLDVVIKSENVDRIIHLGALQLPFCKADPPAGALVNVVGTANVFEAARRNAVSQLVYTSSVAVFDMPGGRLEHDADPRPTSHYGVYKLANEGTARAYWHDSGVASIGLRPLTVYGPGRDQGLTSSPTKAILAAATGFPYEISFGGSTLLHYVPDVAHALVEAAFANSEGAQIFNLNGARASMAEFVSAIEEAIPAAGGLIRFRPRPLPFPDDLDTTGLEAIGPPPVTPLTRGVRQSAELFQALHESGRLVLEDHGLEISGETAIDRPPRAQTPSVA